MHGIDLINRGYENFMEKLEELGAKVELPGGRWLSAPTVRTDAGRALPGPVVAGEARAHGRRRPQAAGLRGSSDLPADAADARGRSPWSG